ncbi:MAG: GDL motif peptide-associated radical SAM/SPASM maturase [Polyangiales bacterium]
MRLPIAPVAAASRRSLPIVGDSRAVDRAARPIYVVWEVTLQCDLACRHCGSRAGRARPDELDTAQALDLVAQLADLQVLEVTLIGGEAYLREDWPQIVRAIRARGMDCSITTGGRGLTRERAQQAADAGVQSVSVSFDGLEQTHDGLRGVRGSFVAAMSAVEHLHEAGVPVNANTQIGRASVREIPALFDLLAGSGIRAWQMQLTVPMGRAADRPELILEPYQMLEVMPMLARVRRRADETGVKLWPGNNIGYFGPYESVLRGGFPAGHGTGCGAGRSVLGLEANGDVKGCPSLPTADYVGGNVRDAPLRTIWEQTAPLRFTRDRTVDELWGYCRGCYYAETCMAGCSWTSHVTFGKRGNNPFCHHRALELLAVGKRERLVKRAAAGGEPFDHGRFEIVLEDWPAEELDGARAIASSGEGWLPIPAPVLEPLP